MTKTMTREEKKQKIQEIRETVYKRLDLIAERIRFCRMDLETERWKDAKEEGAQIADAGSKAWLDLQDIVDVDNRDEPPTEPQKEVEKVKFHGIDGFNRPVFQSLKYKTMFFGSTDILFERGATEEEVLAKVKAEDLLFFGQKFGCEPMGDQSATPLEIVPCDMI